MPLLTITGPVYRVAMMTRQLGALRPACTVFVQRHAECDRLPTRRIAVEPLRGRIVDTCTPVTVVQALPLGPIILQVARQAQSHPSQGQYHRRMAETIECHLATTLRIPDKDGLREPVSLKECDHVRGNVEA